MLRDPDTLTLQRALAGRFSIERELGRGGMGVVYLARDVRLERPVAIKQLAPALATRPDMRARFLREARAAARCFHPHIVPVHAVEEQGDLAWLVMAWVRGESLASRLRREGPLAAPEVHRLASEMGWALAYAHERGVVHRDVKPDNILVEDVSGRFLLTDFGIARLGDDAHTPVDGVLGTARYMAPEQALGDMVDGRADLYALGITLHVAATGRAPFESDAAAALLVQHVTEAAPPIGARAPQLTPALARAIDRCLAKAVEHRFANAEAFLAALQADAASVAPVTPSLLAIRRHLAAAAGLTGWAGIILLTGRIIAFAEGGGLGASITRSVGEAFALIVGALAVARIAEGLHDARRALRRGHTADEVAAALAEPSPEPSRAAMPAARTAAWLAGGVGMAYLHPFLTAVDVALALERVTTVLGVPLAVGAALETVIGMVGTIAPLLMLAKGGAALASRVRERLGDSVLAPLRRTFTRLAGWRLPEQTRRVLPSSDRTEWRLDRDVAAAVAALAPAQREAFADVPSLARTLAQQVSALRAEVARFEDAHAEAAYAESAHDAARREAFQRAHADRLQRLETAVAALEQLRLDVLALPRNSPAGALTEQIERVHDIARRVSAQLEVQQLLAHTPTPA
jgi:serine/threonine-protein kinase